MKLILAIIFSFVITMVYSQNVDEIERLRESVRSYKSGEIHWGVKKDKAYRLLSLVKYDENAIFYLLSSFREENQKDSISQLFEKLIERNRNEVEPYLIREQFYNYEDLGYEDRIKNLKRARIIDSTDVNINYLLGKLNYELFNKEYNGQKRKAELEEFATNSLLYFITICSNNHKYKESLKYPIIQLTYYLGRIKENLEFKDYNKQFFYFPVSAFVGLPSDWESNLNVDVLNYLGSSDLSGVESAVSKINLYSKHLSALEEHVLNDSLKYSIYRFTWLRSFDNPIVIGLKNANDSISLYWKVCGGSGGYEPEKIILHKTRMLKLTDWKSFTKTIQELNFWQLPSKDKGLMGTDGAQWILEGCDPKNYHVVDRWSGGEIESICLKLLKMTDLNINKEDIY